MQQAELVVGDFGIAHHTAVVLEPLHAHLHLVGFPHVVLVGQENVFATGFLQCTLKIECGRMPVWPFNNFYSMVGHLPDDVERAVGRAVVRHDDFVVVGQLAEDRSQLLVNVFFSLIGSYANGNHLSGCLGCNCLTMYCCNG